MPEAKPPTREKKKKKKPKKPEFKKPVPPLPKKKPDRPNVFERILDNILAGSKLSDKPRPRNYFQRKSAELQVLENTNRLLKKKNKHLKAGGGSYKIEVDI